MMMKLKRAHLLALLNFFISIAISLAIANIELILGIDQADIKDRVNYLILNSNIYDYVLRLEGLKVYLGVVEQSLFQLINLAMANLGLSSDLSVKIIIFFSTFVACFILLQKGKINPLWVAVSFLFPWLLVNYVMTIRQGLAAAIFLLSWFYLSGRRQILVWLLTPLIHSSFLFVLLLVSFCRISLRFKLEPILLMLSTVVGGLITGYFAVQFASFLGFDMYNYAFKQGFQIGLGTIFWSVVLGLFVMQGKLFWEKHLVSIIAIVFYVSSTILFSPLSRVLQNFMVLILIAGFSLKGRSRLVFETAIVAHVLFLIYEYMQSGNFGGMLIE